MRITEKFKKDLKAEFEHTVTVWGGNPGMAYVLVDDVVVHAKRQIERRRRKRKAKK